MIVGIGTNQFSVVRIFVAIYVRIKMDKGNIIGFISKGIELFLGYDAIRDKGVV